MAKIPRTKVYNPQKAEAYVGKGVLRNGDTLTAIKGHFSPVPNGPLIKKKGPFKGSTLKNGSTVKAGGQTHKVFKKKLDKGIGNKGDIVVDHTAGPSAGKWDKINLTEKSKAKTVKQGVASVKKWHRENPTMKNGGSSPAWTRSEGKDPKGGLNRKGVASYRAANPGSKLKMAVTTKPSKLKAGSKAAGRRKSFCARMSGVKGPAKKPNGEPTRKTLALRKWNC
jgi:hypothetical protein